MWSAQCTQCAHCASWVASRWDAFRRENVPLYLVIHPIRARSSVMHASIRGLRTSHLLSIPMTVTICAAGELAALPAVQASLLLPVLGSLPHCACAELPWPRMLLSQTTCMISILLSFTLYLTNLLSVTVPTRAPAAPPPNLPHSTHTAGGPAMDAFDGVLPPVAGNAGTQRAASAVRSLRNGPFAAALGSHHGARTPYPENSVWATSTPQVEILVVCWPLVLPGSEYHLSTATDPTPRIAIQNERAKVYANHLNEAKLILKVKIPQRELIPPAEFFAKSKSF
ncbi:hypothetical protein MSAN_01828600 [Mycena sanguinolenta]|uniref:Uncharacterized protein n=1 Tax=Mycena sanguinolenta TaxID=230812 RepID=A0A8H6XT96_9AGAR|nr:hypothetical protein MSAN_01828600 [Mycena sanguinolenta]